ncbi:carnitine dehydratase, partial [Kitasatospora indigofera]
MTPGPDAATAHAWTALGGDEALLERVSFHGPPGLPDARLPVRELARATVAVCSLAAAELTAARGGRAVPAVRTDEDAVATAFVSERHLRIDGRAATTFAPLSGFWRTADGWVRTHANYPHHRARLLAALGLPDGEDEAAVHRLAAVLRELPAEQVQE